MPARQIPASEGPRPIGAKPGDVKVGNCVKRGFTTASGKVEHMWVHIECIGHDDYVHGHLHSEPVYTDYDPPLKWGTPIHVPYALIEGIEQCKAESRKAKTGHSR